MPYAEFYYNPAQVTLSTNWTNPNNAIDGNIGTGAVIAQDLYDFIVMNTSGKTVGDKIQFQVTTAAAVANVDVDAYYEGAWHDVFDGTVAKDTLITKTLPDGLRDITQVRLRGSGLNQSFTLFEITVKSTYVSPDDFTDVGDGWEDETYIYDRDSTSGGYHGPADPASYPLELIAPSGYDEANALAILMQEITNSSLSFKIEIYDGSNWTTIHDGVMTPVGTLNIIEFTAQVVTKVRIQPQMGAFSGLINIFEVYLVSEYVAPVPATIPIFQNYYRQLRG